MGQESNGPPTIVALVDYRVAHRWRSFHVEHCGSQSLCPRGLPHSGHPYWVGRETTGLVHLVLDAHLLAALQPARPKSGETKTFAERCQGFSDIHMNRCVAEHQVRTQLLYTLPDSHLC